MIDITILSDKNVALTTAIKATVNTNANKTTPTNVDMNATVTKGAVAHSGLCCVGNTWCDQEERI